MPRGAYDSTIPVEERSAERQRCCNQQPNVGSADEVREAAVYAMRFGQLNTCFKNVKRADREQARSEKQQGANGGQPSEPGDQGSD